MDHVGVHFFGACLTKAFQDQGLATARKACTSAGHAAADAEQLRSRIDELVQELEDKNAELEERDQIVNQLKEQMAQIMSLVGGMAPGEAAEGLPFEQPEPEILASNKLY